jgi:hypothetical protein
VQTIARVLGCDSQGYQLSTALIPDDVSFLSPLTGVSP